MGKMGDRIYFTIFGIIYFKFDFKHNSQYYASVLNIFIGV